MTQKTPWCYAPFGHLNQHAEGHLAPCCAWTSKSPGLNKSTNLYDAFNGEYMENLRNRMLEHDIPSNCSKCVKREEQGGHSNRMSFFKDKDRFWPEDIIENPKLVDLDISFSNYCNLKCRMCHSGLSTSWASDQEQINHLDYVSAAEIGHVKNPPIDKKSLEEVKVLHFKGGEPLLDPQFKEFINNVDIEKVEHLKLTTNGTFFNKAIFERLALAKKTLISFSVDAVSDGMYRYIRGGGRYGIDYAEKNVKQVIDAVAQGNAIVQINVTMQAYNLFEYNDIKSWWESIRQYALEKHGKHIVRSCASIGIIISYPKYLKMGVLPLDYRTQVADELYSNDEALYKFVTQPEEPGFENFIDYTNRLDKLRNENLLEAEPRFSPLFDQYK